MLLIASKKKTLYNIIEITKREEHNPITPPPFKQSHDLVSCLKLAAWNLVRPSLH